MTSTTQQPDPFEEFISHYLYLGDEVFAPIDHPAPTDRRWHYGQYQSTSAVKIYSQPDARYDNGYALRPTEGYAHAMLRYLPDVRPGWTAIELTISDPIVGYVRNDSADFRHSSGVYEYVLMFMISGLIIVSLSLLIFLYAIPQAKARRSDSVVIESAAMEQRIEQFVSRLEATLHPLQ